MKQGVGISGHSFLITGGAGFVGTHVVKALLGKGARRVVILDYAEPGANLKDLLADTRVTCVRMGIDNLAEMTKAMQEVDGVFHMAVLPLGPCTENPELAFEVNIRGSFNVFRAAELAGVKKIVYSSASSVYGDTLEVMGESHPLNAKSYYGITKLCAEYLLRPLGDKVAYVVLRYMNVYGPGQKGVLIPSVIHKIKSRQGPVINGDGSASFDFVHVADVARCNLLAMETELSGETFNVGSGEEASVKQIVETLIRLSGTSVEPVFNRAADVAMFRRVGDSSKAERLLGYLPSVSLDEGLKGLIEQELLLKS